MNRLHYPDTKANPPNDQPANLFTEARLPRHLVHQTQAAILRDTFSNSGSIRIGMERLQIRPTGTADENPRIALFGSDARCHRSPVSILNSLLVSCAHRAAIDLHRLACDVQPIAASPLSEECFGVAFFAETRSPAAAGERLRHTLDLVAAEAAQRALRFVGQRPWLEIVHQAIPGLPSPLQADTAIPVSLVRIRYRGLSQDQVEGLMGEAVQALPAILSGSQEAIDVLAISLSSAED